MKDYEYLYDFETSAKILGFSYTEVTRKCKRQGFKLVRGRYGKLFLNAEQLELLRTPLSKKRSKLNTIEIIKVTETFYIYESRMNYPD